MALMTAGKRLANAAVLCASFLALASANHNGEGEDCICNQTSSKGDGSAPPRRAQKDPYEDGGSSTWCGCADDTPTDWDSYNNAVAYMEQRTGSAPAPAASPSSSSSGSAPRPPPPGYSAYVAPAPAPKSQMTFNKNQQEDLDGAASAGVNVLVLLVAGVSALAMAGKY